MGFSGSRGLDFNLLSHNWTPQEFIQPDICNFLSSILSEVFNLLTPHHVGHNKYKLRPSILTGRKYYLKLSACQNSDTFWDLTTYCNNSKSQDKVEHEI